MKKTVNHWLVATSVAALLSAPGISFANAEVENLSKDPTSWATWGGDYYGTRYSSLTQINKDTAKKPPARVDFLYRCPAWT
jgi:glucose dehydrogenase